MISQLTIDISIDIVVNPLKTAYIFPICSMVLEYESQHVPEQFITQFYRFLYTNTMLRIMALYLPIQNLPWRPKVVPSSHPPGHSTHLPGAGGLWLAQHAARREVREVVELAELVRPAPNSPGKSWGIAETWENDGKMMGKWWGNPGQW